MIPTSITRDHVLQAIAEIGGSVVPASRQSVDYFVEYEGKRFPPKYVVSVAHRFANGAELDPGAFGAGVGKGAANAFLQRLGFRIVRGDGTEVELPVEGSPRALREARRQDPEAARALLESLLPDEDVRRACLAFLADAIVRCHAFGAARWSLSLRPPRKVHLNLGRLLVFGISDGSISFGLHPDSLSEEERRAPRPARHEERPVRLRSGDPDLPDSRAPEHSRKRLHICHPGPVLGAEVLHDDPALEQREPGSPGTISAVSVPSR